MNTTGLDATIQSRIVDLLVELKSALGITTMLISHDINVISLRATGSHGFLQLDMVDQGSSFEGNLLVDIIDSAHDGKLTFGELAFLDADATLTAIADVDLGLKASFGGNAAFPLTLH